MSDSNLENIRFRAQPGTKDRVQRLVEHSDHPGIWTASDWYRHVIHKALRLQEIELNKEIEKKRAAELRRKKRRASTRRSKGGRR